MRREWGKKTKIIAVKLAALHSPFNRLNDTITDLAKLNEEKRRQNRNKYYAA